MVLQRSRSHPREQRGGEAGQTLCLWEPFSESDLPERPRVGNTDHQANSGLFPLFDKDQITWNPFLQYFLRLASCFSDGVE